MKTVLHKADTRGHANHGWLDSKHTFSFASYYNADRMNFGVLRVINDDTVMGGRGFDTHPHKDMEIISIPLFGDLEHKDSMGNTTVINEGDIQVMSAGTGVYHSEYNKNENKQVKFLQIWIIPHSKGVTPRYDQVSIREIQKKNEFSQILSPNPREQGVWIHQNAWFHIGNIESGTSSTYKLKDNKNGLYIFVIEGDIEIEGQELNSRDGFGIWEIESIGVQALSSAKILVMEIPVK
jgi:redox-sensitive bicupin YhaK (pirin superfamily)